MKRTFATFGALCGLVLALSAIGAGTSATASEGPNTVRISFCMNCVLSSYCSGEVVKHHIPPIVEPGEGSYPIPSGSSTEDCTQGFCYPHHEECGSESDEKFERSVLAALRLRDSQRLREVLIASGRTVVVDHDRRLLSLLACNGKDILIKRRVPSAVLRQLASTPNVTAIAVMRAD